MFAGGTVLAADSLYVDFKVPRGPFAHQDLHALAGISLRLRAGSCLGVVGESGCGKSTLARALLRLVPLAGGAVRWLDRDITKLSARELRPLRRYVQFVAQDPAGSLDPRRTIASTIAELIYVHEPTVGRAQCAIRTREAMRQVGLDERLADRFPHELSGGQAQRVGIARALAVRPKVLICDEPVSALDVSVQAQIVNLLLRLKDELDLALVFISHNLAVVRQLADEVMVLYLGRVLERGDAHALYARPRHPYTRALLDAVPAPTPHVARPHPLALGEPPSPTSPPSGCVYHPRCPYAQPLCRSTRPRLEATDSGFVGCHFWREL